MKHPCVAAAHKHYDEMLSRVRAEHARKGSPVVTHCCSGCFSCCKEPCWVMRVEVEHMVDGLPESELEGVKARTQTWLDAMTAHGLFEIEEPNVHVYRKACAWCPLLKDGKCLAYKRRPLSCRGHMALRPKAFCDSDELRHEQHYAMIPELQTRAFQVMFKDHNALEGDHIGSWLARQLLGVEVKSKAHLDARSFPRKSRPTYEPIT